MKKDLIEVSGLADCYMNNSEVSLYVNARMRIYYGKSTKVYILSIFVEDYDEFFPIVGEKQMKFSELNLKIWVTEYLEEKIGALKITWYN